MIKNHNTSSVTTLPLSRQLSLSLHTYLGEVCQLGDVCTSWFVIMEFICPCRLVRICRTARQILVMGLLVHGSANGVNKLGFYLSYRLRVQTVLVLRDEARFLAPGEGHE